MDIYDVYIFPSFSHYTITCIVDPPGNLSVIISCHGDEQRVEIEWESPPTLHGVEITHYTFIVEEMNYSASGDKSNMTLRPPSCQNRTICGAASTAAGTSSYKCFEGECSLYCNSNNNMHRDQFVTVDYEVFEI